MSVCTGLGQSQDDDRRNCGRLLTEQLDTEIGRVVNLSASGMRVVARQSLKGRLGETIDLVLGHDAQVAQVKGEIVWACRVGFRTHLAGIRFLDLADADRRRLTDLAKSAVFLPGLGNQKVAETKTRAA